MECTLRMAALWFERHSVGLGEIGKQAETGHPSCSVMLLQKAYAADANMTKPLP